MRHIAEGGPARSIQRIISSDGLRCRDPVQTQVKIVGYPLTYGIQGARRAVDFSGKRYLVAAVINPCHLDIVVVILIGEQTRLLIILRWRKGEF